MFEETQLYLRIQANSVEIVERLNLPAATKLTKQKRRFAYSKLLSRELSQPATPVLNPVAVVVRRGCLCTPKKIEAQEHVLAYIDSSVRVRLRTQVNREHPLERYREKTTVW